ncbi:unnamed protein product [Urochloa humidicola]
MPRQGSGWWSLPAAPSWPQKATLRPWPGPCRRPSSSAARPDPAPRRCRHHTVAGPWDAGRLQELRVGAAIEHELPAGAGRHQLAPSMAGLELHRGSALPAGRRRYRPPAGKAARSSPAGSMRRQSGEAAPAVVLNAARSHISGRTVKGREYTGDKVRGGREGKWWACGPMVKVRPRGHGRRRGHGEEAMIL